jgi:hypothetical protein
MAMLLDPREPHQILRVYSSVEDMLAYTADELMGRPLACLFSMRSEPIHLIDSAIEVSVYHSTTTRRHVTLYDRYGKDVLMVATFAPCVEQAVLQGCRMDLKRICPLRFQEAADRQNKRCLLEPNKLDAIPTADPESHSNSIGEPNQVFGMTFGASQCGFRPIKEDAVIRPNPTPHGSEKFVCTPVSDALNVRTKHGTVEFMLSPPSSAALSSSTVRRLCNRNTGSSIHASSTPSSPLQESPSSPPTFAPAIVDKLPTILPGSRPARAARWPPFAISSPMVITRELIDTLHGLPLPRAARTIGVSPSAFKKSCRRLGIARWDYKRGPGRRPGRGAADSMPAGRMIVAAGQQSGQASADCRHGPSPPCCLSEADQSWSGSDLSGPATPGPDFTPCQGSIGDGGSADGRVEWLLEPGRLAWWDSEDRSPGLTDSDDALVLAMLARPWPVEAA